MSLFSEFKAFIRRGNVVDLAVGLIMGAAFTKIVNSLVNDVIMPPIGYLIGGKEFTEIKFVLPRTKILDPLAPGGLKELEPATINIGSFLQASFDFLLISICVFAMIKAMNAFKRSEAAAPPATPELSLTDKLLTEIRDELKSR
ncbi:large-conductance mechanosensitive channel protein MscL [Schlesneria paludicola]|uniref:large-conductance mechanosensitive channel protein MscL n=1 Tax=Schlesneria paludicola TaxID=360056 RepID=UPI00029A1476|nr:large-conductance mechanosensitive channel protein MscL [Schlesneria paludicola]